MRHVRLFSTITQALTEMFLAELHEKHFVSDAFFLADGAPWLQAAYYRHSSDSSISFTGIGMPSNACLKRRNAERTRLPITSDTLSRNPPTYGFKHSPSASIS